MPCPSHTRSLATLSAMVFSSAAMANPVDVFILAGQSNMVGSGQTSQLPSHMQAPLANSLYWFDLNRGDFKSDTTGPLRPSIRSTTHGMEITFGHTIHDAATDQPTTGVIKVAVNGSALDTQWLPTLTEGDLLYQRLINQIQTATDELDNQGIAYNLRGFFWPQGESDASRDDRSSRYADNLATLIDSLREDLDTPELPVFISSLSTQTTYPFGQRVRDAQLQLTNLDPNAHLINTDDLTLKEDQIHYTGLSQQILGQRMAEAYLATVPEPGSLAYLGLLALTATRRRRA